MDDDRGFAGGAEEDAAEDLAVPEEQAEDVKGGANPTVLQRKGPQTSAPPTVDSKFRHILEDHPAGLP